MTRDEFKSFTEGAIEDVLRLAEEQSGKTVPRKIAFRWMMKDAETLHDGIVEAIVDRVFVDEDNIYPCVDLGVWDLLDDGTSLVVRTIAGYAPRPFANNWTGREGPFVRIVGQNFLIKMAGEEPKGKIFGFNIPDMKNLK